jgi:2-iminoacetate synthase ThiH
MRPNVEITHTLQGRIKDFAEEEDLTLSEAYTELLNAGLETLETQE